jgi:deoxyribose-phosphate aldolase
MKNMTIQPSNCEMSPALIEHTILKDPITDLDIEAHIAEAKALNVGAVCLPVAFVPLAKKLLQGTDILVVTVADFPKGDKDPMRKAEEAVVGKNLGADEIDLVMDYQALVAKDYQRALKGLTAVVAAVAPTPVKVIVETSALNHEQLAIACALVALSGAKFIKTSTGFHEAGARASDIALMRKLLPDNILIKASGGIKTHAAALAMVNAGAVRIGASQSRNILQGP